MLNPTTYRPTKAERAKILEALRLAADGAETTSGLDLFEIEEAIGDALIGINYDMDYGDARDIAEALAPKFDGITL